jgi:GNAT superfamily N-acetyltransferase
MGKVDFMSLQVRCSARPAQTSDSERIAQLTRQLGYDCTGEDIRERLADIEGRKEHTIYVAELSGGRIAGWIAACVLRSVESNKRAEISGLVVDEQVRSRGIGKVLLKSAERWAQSLGCETITVRSNVKRERAHRFYEGNGYEHEKTQKQLRKRL